MLAGQMTQFEALAAGQQAARDEMASLKQQVMQGHQGLADEQRRERQERGDALAAVKNELQELALRVRAPSAAAAPQQAQVAEKTRVILDPMAANTVEDWSRVEGRHAGCRIGGGSSGGLAEMEAGENLLRYLAEKLKIDAYRAGFEGSADLEAWAAMQTWARRVCRTPILQRDTEVVSEMWRVLRWAEANVLGGGRVD
eukprot:TRINITY_DN11040_c0_g2_i1.p1 TRINITY_DN11040_c0_g2~~TRINITY_DN11040_c0_g2_i1.p1  ORF type:complete len:199 (-),score=41.36 TRINITY_DN11040_c0_g2_i1:15-611(-)